MNDPKTEALLKNFLLEDQAARAKGITIEALYDAVCKVASDRLIDRKAAMQDRERAAEDRRSVLALTEVVGRYTRRTHAMERQLQTVSASEQFPDWRPDPREITGTHELAEIRRAAKREVEHDDMVATNTWWRENLGKTALAIIAALVIASLSACVTIAMQRTPLATPTQAPK